jgi:hypothetical protein
MASCVQRKALIADLQVNVHGAGLILFPQSCYPPIRPPTKRVLQSVHLAS